MIARFLKAKHWQIFLILFGIPLFFQLLIVVLMMVNVITQNTSDVLLILHYMQAFAFIMLLYTLIFFGWYWSVVMGLHKRLPDDLKISTTLFKIFFFFPLLYIVILSLFFGSLNYIDPYYGNTTLLQSINLIIILPLHLFSIFCIFYMMYFTAKVFKMLELGRKVSLSDYIPEFFMLWFLPVGIWFIQPKLNSMVGNKQN